MHTSRTRPDWPTVTLIRIIRGTVSGAQVRDALAARDPAYPNAYTVATGDGSGERIVRGDAGDSIDEWEELVPVPTAALEDLQDEWQGPDSPSIYSLRNVDDILRTLFALRDVA